MVYDFIKIERFSPLLDALERTSGVAQSPDWHPEGDVFNHSLQVLHWAFRESNDIHLIVAAMLHDIGKSAETYGHESFGVGMLEGYISDKTAWLIKNHMRFWYLVSGEMHKLSSVTELFQNEWLPDLVMLCRWDKKGRNPNKQMRYDRGEILNRLRDVNRKSVSVPTFTEQPLRTPMKISRGCFV